MKLIKIGAGAGILVAGGFFAYRVWKETQKDIQKQLEQDELNKDIYDDETLIRVFKLVIKESYPVLDDGVDVCHKLKLELRRENGGVEPQGLQTTIYNQITSTGKHFLF
jgi:hypothetical protein